MSTIATIESRSLFVAERFAPSLNDSALRLARGNSSFARDVLANETETHRIEPRFVPIVALDGNLWSGRASKDDDSVRAVPCSNLLENVIDPRSESEPEVRERVSCWQDAAINTMLAIWTSADRARKYEDHDFPGLPHFLGIADAPGGVNRSLDLLHWLQEWRQIR